MAAVSSVTSSRQYRRRRLDGRSTGRARFLVGVVVVISGISFDLYGATYESWGDDQYKENEKLSFEGTSTRRMERGMVWE